MSKSLPQPDARGDRRRSPISFLTQDETKRLFAAVKSKRDRAIFLTAYRHGLRLFMLGLVLLLPTQTLAHPGGLDANGCHTNHQTGEYHCHRGPAAQPTAKRSSAVRQQFLKSQGLTHTPAGCQVDHITPLSCGGTDEVSNLQLLCGDALKEKERTEQSCR